jgi:spore germination protein KC
MNTISLTKAVKLMLAFSICSFTILLTGCWDRVEINDLALVLATGLDKTDDDKIELSVQLAIPKAMGGGQGMSGGGGKTTTVEKATGETIFEAMSRLQEKVPRRIFLGHNQVIIIGEKLAEEGIQKHIDFFARHPDPRIEAFTFVTDGKAIDALKVIPDLERSSAEIARELANFKVGLSVTVKDLLQMISSEAGATALPWIEVEQEPEGKGGLRVNGTAVFKRDKMVGRIDDKVTRGVLWLRNEIELSAVTFKPEGAEDQISFNLLRSRTELIPKIENGNWKMIVKIVTEDDVVENETKLNLMNLKIVKKLEKQLAEDIDKRIRLTFEQIQKEMEADIFGFADAFHRQYPDQWSEVKDQWNEKFPEIKVEIKSKAYIRRSGMSTSPQGVPEKEVKGK